MIGQPDVRPLGVGEILDAGIKLTRRRFLDLALLVAIMTVPVQVLSVIVSLSALPDDEVTGDVLFGTTESTATALDTLQLGATLAVTLLGLLATWLAIGACTGVLSGAYLGREMTWRESLRFALSRFWALLGVNLLMLVVIGAGVVACIIPGIWLYVAYSLAVPALLVEAIGPGRALSRSFNLVRRRWWPIFGIQILGYLLVTVVQTFLVLPLTGVVIVADASPVAFVVGQGIVTLIAEILTRPFLIAVIVLIYFDQRVRREGFDIALALQHLDTAPPPPPPASTGPVGGPPSAPAPGSRPPLPGPAPPPGWSRSE